MLDLNTELHESAIERQRLEIELTRLRAESSRLRKALKPIIARLEMPAGGFSRTQDVMIQASELVELQAALSGEDEVR